MECKVRKHGYGTFDERWGGRWNVKGEKISATPSELSEHFGMNLKGKTDSEPYWRKYLAGVRQQRDASGWNDRPCDQHKADVLTQLEFGNLDRDRLKALSAQIDALLRQEPKNSKPTPMPTFSKEVLDAGSALSIGKDDICGLAALDTIIDKTRGEADGMVSVTAEIETYMATFEQSPRQERSLNRRALTLLSECCGNIAIQQVNVTHWRAFMAKNEARGKSERDTYNWYKAARVFLVKMACDHDLTFRFLDNVDNQLSCPHGNKDTWSLEQVRLALRKATGVARTVLLLCLNCGWYREDIAEFQPCHFNGTHTVKKRQKLAHDPNALVCHHLLWRETIEALQYGLKLGTIDKAFKKLRDEYGLPEMKHLRKTMRQWIGKCGNDVGLLYRGVRPTTGADAKYYWEMTPDEIAKLDVGLRAMHDKLFGDAQEEAEAA